MFLFNSSDYWNDKEKMIVFRETNTKISKLTSKIKEISTEIFRYDIYPFWVWILLVNKISKQLEIYTELR